MSDVTDHTKRFIKFLAEYLESAEGKDNSAELKAIQSSKLLVVLQTRLAKAALSQNLESIDLLDVKSIDEIQDKLIEDVLNTSSFLSVQEQQDLRNRYVSSKR